ncbi:MAG: S8 family serine peptidase [Chloroflexi bacterium]|nr:S8 family serine peptidase [Chloroflexota bacterium]
MYGLSAYRPAGWIVLSLALAILLGWATVSSGAASPVRVRVDPRVLADTANGNSAQFIVVLKSQANARAVASQAPTRRAQGRLVFGALTRAASATQSGLRAELDGLGAKYRSYWIINMLVVKGDRHVLDAVLARSDIQEVESDDPFRVALEQPVSGAKPRTASGIDWNISQIRAPEVWALGDTGQGRVYANSDTGVQWDHPALKSHYRGWDGTTADHNYNWWDAIHEDINGNGSNPCNPSGFTALPASGSAAPCDDYGHGTHTMGTGIGDDGAGNQIGVAPGAKWIACRNMDEGVGRPSTYIECLQFFLAPTDLNGDNPNPSLMPDAVGNSYTCPLGLPPGGETCEIDSLQMAVDNMRAAGVFMALSAGNSGASCSTIDEPPAFYDSGIAVGATDSQDNIAAFSSRGPVTIDGSGRKKPDLSAPGVSVLSSFPNNSWATLSGTSMASPHVAGAVLLLWSAYPALARDVDRTEFLLEQSAVRRFSSQGCGGDTIGESPNNVYGFGRLDVRAAYDLAAHVPTPSLWLFPFVQK